MQRSTLRIVPQSARCKQYRAVSTHTLTSTINFMGSTPSYDQQLQKTSLLEIHISKTASNYRVAYEEPIHEKSVPNLVAVSLYDFLSTQQKLFLLYSCRGKYFAAIY
jgi:hypothetical protein